MIGRTIGNFVVARKIGAGGMGTVYVATHPRMGKRVAIKVLRPEHGGNPTLARRFLTEARAVARIRSEHVVDVLDRRFGRGQRRGRRSNRGVERRAEEQRGGVARPRRRGVHHAMRGRRHSIAGDVLEELPGVHEPRSLDGLHVRPATVGVSQLEPSDLVLDRERHEAEVEVRGDWGELMLESVLRSAGLEEGMHYERQRRTRDDDDRILQPDVVIRLPDERRIVVDSKVNLVAWQEAMNAGTLEAQQEALRRHAVALRQHVKDLVDRNYPRALGDSALDVTLLFVPIEGALSAALGTDHELQTFAFERNVVFSSPNTLMAMLRVVDRLWTRDQLQRQALDISRSGGLLLDALTAFLDDFGKVDERLHQARQAYDAAKRRLHESPQSVAARAQRLVELGVRGKRALPRTLAEREDPGLPGADEEPPRD